jgi:succinylarginine dihydrolase
MATSSTESIIKYRPYLSLAEISALLNILDTVEVNESTKDLESAAQALLKTKTLAELGLQSAAYKTNPRPTLVDKLGFGTDSVALMNLKSPIVNKGEKE